MYKVYCNGVLLSESVQKLPSLILTGKKKEFLFYYRFLFIRVYLSFNFGLSVNIFTIWQPLFKNYDFC